MLANFLTDLFGSGRSLLFFTPVFSSLSGFGFVHGFGKPPFCVSWAVIAFSDFHVFHVRKCLDYFFHPKLFLLFFSPVQLGCFFGVSGLGGRRVFPG